MIRGAGLPPSNRFSMTDLLLQIAEADNDAAFTRDTIAAMLMVLGVLVIAILLTVSIRGKVAHRQSSRASAREQIDQIKAAGRKRSEHSGPSAEGIEQVRHLAVLLDNKAERLEQLIAEADRRIEALGGQRHDGGEPHHRGSSVETSSHNARSAPVRSVPKEPLDPLTRSVYELADDGRSPVEIARELDEQIGKVDLILALRQR